MLFTRPQIALGDVYEYTDVASEWQAQQSWSHTSSFSINTSFTRLWLAKICPLGSGMCRAELFPAGWGESENPRARRRGAARRWKNSTKVCQLLLEDLYYSIMFLSRKTLSAYSVTFKWSFCKNVVASCTKDQLKSFFFPSPFKQKFLGIICVICGAGRGEQP